MKHSRIVAVLLIALAAMTSSNAFAGPKGDRPMAAKVLDMLSKALESVTDLADSQKEQTKTALAEAEAQLVAVREEAKSIDKADPAARKAIREKATEIVANAKTQIETTLNDSQKETFRATLKTLRAEAAQKRSDKQKDGVHKTKKDGNAKGV